MIIKLSMNILNVNLFKFCKKDLDKITAIYNNWFFADPLSIIKMITAHNEITMKIL